MKTLFCKKFLLAVTLACGALSIQAAPSAEDIIKRHIEAIGGVKANKKITTRVLSGVMTMPALGHVESPMKILSKAPDKMMSRFDIPNVGRIAEGFDGKVAWAQNPFTGLIEKTGAQLDQVKSQSNFYRPIEFKTGYSNWSYGGERRIEGKAAHVLKGTTDQGRTETYFLDKKTLMIVRAELPLVSPAGSMNTVTTFADYRKVDGAVLPFKVSMISPPNAAFTIKIREVKQNVKIDDSIFAMPVK